MGTCLTGDFPSHFTCENTHVGFHVKLLTKIGTCQQFTVKLPGIKFHGSSVSRTSAALTLNALSMKIIFILSDMELDRTVSFTL